MKLLESYLRELQLIRIAGAGVPETSYYVPLAELLNGVGKTLTPRVRCIMNPSNQGAGIPDAGLFTADQFKKSEGLPQSGQLPSRGVVEVKPVGVDAGATAGGDQVARYMQKYRQVLVTNYRDFILVGQDAEGRIAKLESYRLADSEKAFWAACARPARLVEERGASFEEFIKRVMLHAAPLVTPRDVAWFLASYAREARIRVDQAGSEAVAPIRKALEEGLGMEFQGQKGEHFFRSTLVQTLFYGVFSAWVLWSKQHPAMVPGVRFNWQTAAHYLRVPVLRKLFHEVADPGQLETLNLPEVLDWAGELLNRVDRPQFFARFEEEHAVQYFYEPFLEAYDPELRKELGVWYTPPEIVRYMVARVDGALRDELGIEDGLADPRVYILDPCCGTGAYLVEVLNYIAGTLRAKGGDALLADDLKAAAMKRVFGFEILPAPFVISHLQLGLLLQKLGAPLSNATNERAAVYLTNALTGWEPPKGPKQHFLFPEFEAERDAAGRVKQVEQILVVLGNPPYNGFAGVAVAEERELSNAYRITRRAPAPQGQGLNDLYVRFFRMAERKIVEGTQKGIVCFISNYSWLDGLSFTGMRERYLDVFDSMWIDNLHGDRMMSEYAPDGQTSETVFAMHGSSSGIRIGTAIALLVRKSSDRSCPSEVLYRDTENARASDRRAALLSSLDGESIREQYGPLTPVLGRGGQLKPVEVTADYMSWPPIPAIQPTSSPGVKTSRDDVVVDIDRDRLIRRMAQYFDPEISHEEMRLIAPGAMQSTARFNAEAVRDHLRKRGFLREEVVRFCYRPFDLRWLYWEPETKLLDEKRETLHGALRAGNLFLTCRQKGERQTEGSPFYVTRSLPDWHLTRPGSICFPLTTDGLGNSQMLQFSQWDGQDMADAANLSDVAREYLRGLDIDAPDAKPKTSEMIWMHVVAVGHSRLYLAENAGAIRQEWPRMPLPSDGKRLASSASLGHATAELLDPECPVANVTAGAIRPELRVLAAISRVGAGSLDPNAGELELNAGWGHAGQEGIAMPGQGRVSARVYSPSEMAALQEGTSALGLTMEQILGLLGESTTDVYLNDVAYWQNIPIRVWEYTLGGYQVIKKWLSYREKKLLGRSLTKDEVREVTGMARRIAAILLMGPALDANYEQAKADSYPWPRPEPRGWTF